MSFLYKWIGLLLLLVFCTGWPLASAQAAKGVWMDEQSVRVGLWTKQSSISISADAPFLLRDAASKKILQRYKANEKLFLAQKNQRLTVNGKKLTAQRILLTLEEENVARSLELNRKVYRGVIEITQRVGEGISAVNILPLETYLYSIVPGEMPASWNMEALKAQAVAARSFALYSKNKHAAEGFDVCTTTHCQVYSGRSVEMERSSQAVDDTRGLVMLYRNQPIAAVFHSASGGYTENSEDVWGNYIPYLRSVKDFDQGTPYAQWKQELTPQQLQEKLASYGYRLGKLQAVQMSVLTQGGKTHASDRTVSGRVKSLRLIGEQGNVTIEGGKFRSMLGLKSTLFDIMTIVPEKEKIEVPIGMYYKKNIDINLPPYQEKGLLNDQADIRRIYWGKDEKVIIEGYGWGHGLGMSQWGAKMMADQADHPSALYFKEILQHYYQNVILKKVY